MRKFFKIVLIALLLLLIVFAILADLPIGKAYLAHLDLSLYLKLVSLFGLSIALFLSLGYKHRVDASQKYKRAKRVLADAESKAKQKEQVLDEKEKQLSEAFKQKEQELNSQIRAAQSGYESRVDALKKQNLELKEALNKLMRVVKRQQKAQK